MGKKYRAQLLAFAHQLQSRLSSSKEESTVKWTQRGVEIEVFTPRAEIIVKSFIDKLPKSQTEEEVKNG